MLDNTRRRVSPILRWALPGRREGWRKRASALLARTQRAPAPAETPSAHHRHQGPREPGRWVDPLDQQPLEVHLRSLLVLCQGLTRHYQATPEIVLERWWWRSLHQAGVRLRERLEEARAYQDTLTLTRQELEQAYLVLIQVAYFFEPGGIAEATCKEQAWATDAQEFRRF